MAIKDYRFENLPRSIQIAVVTVLVLCIAVAYYVYYLKDNIAQRDAIQADIAKLEVSVAQGTAIEGRLRRFRQELAQLEERLAVLQNILPAEKETPIVLRSVQQMAASSNLTINRFAPQPVIPRAFYSDWPIQIEVEGSYDGLGTFFEKVSQATRIINVDSISITGMGKDQTAGHSLNASYTATTFVYKEDNEASSQKPEPQQPKSKGKRGGTKR